MEYRVTLSAETGSEINETFSYIANTLGSPLAAQSFKDTARKTFSALSINPCAYPVDIELSELANTTIRRISIKNYQAFYLVNESEKKVRIVTLLHMRQSKTQFLEDFYLDK